MVEALGAKVEKLTRIAIGSLQLGEMESGSMRELTADELRALERRD
jgi:16S rRNA U516 pseudouridylate synthase RsuA-like enzyme